MPDRFQGQGAWVRRCVGQERILPAQTKEDIARKALVAAVDGMDIDDVAEEPDRGGGGVSGGAITGRLARADRGWEQGKSENNEKPNFISHF